MNYTSKIYLVTHKLRNTIFVLFLLSQILPKNVFKQWVESKNDILNSDIKYLEFIYTIRNEQDIYGGEKTEEGSLILSKDARFRLVLGPRTIVAQKDSWSSYDSRNNQIIIQYPDTTLLKSVLFWLDTKKMRNLPIATGNNDNQLQVNIDGRQYHLEFKNGEIDSIISQYNNLKLTISKINLQKLEHLKNEYFILDTKKAMVIDLRDE